MKGNRWFVLSIVTFFFMMLLCQAAFPSTLTVWMKKGFVEEQNVMFEERVKEFATMKNIDVNVELIAYEDFFPKWTASIESGNLPDLSFFGYQEIGQFYASGIMRDLTPLVAKIEEEYGNIFEKSKKAVTFEDKIYGIPFWGEGTALYYRNDLFQENGISAPPNSWEEFRDYAIKTTDPQKGVFGAGIGYGAGNSDAEWLSRSIIWAFGGAIFGEDGKSVVIHSPETIKAVDFITRLFTEDKVTPPGAVGWNDGGNNTSYISGQSAMVVNTGSIIAAMRKNNPEMLDKTGVIVLPQGVAGRFTAGISNNLGIFKNAPNPELAEELLIFLMDPNWYKEWIVASAPLALPVYESLANEPIWAEPHNKAFMDSIKTFEYLGYRGPYSPAAGEVYNMRIINKMFEDIIVNNVSIEEAIVSFEQEVKQILNK
ncbi:MAG: sugar ABC transporter substrate-binding protein [Candidatus Atribacteria bacterium]|nr:sugar ABC transporter substrate-binding protein [Candidatus Atribacteria bacterium]